MGMEPLTQPTTPFGYGNLGSTTNLAADGDGDGTVDPDDYAVWRDNFGATRGGNPVTPVPEPTTLALVLIGVVVSAGLTVCRSAAKPRMTHKS